MKNGFYDKIILDNSPQCDGKVFPPNQSRIIFLERDIPIDKTLKKSVLTSDDENLSSLIYEENRYKGNYRRLCFSEELQLSYQEHEHVLRKLISKIAI